MRKSKRVAVGRPEIPRERMIEVRRALLDRGFLSIKEAARSAGIDPVTLYDMIRSGPAKDPRARVVLAVESLGLTGIVPQRK